MEGEERMANVNIRIDSEVKKRAEQVFENLGLTASAAINLFYKQVIRTNSIPFELKAEIPNKETLEALKEVEEMDKHPDDFKKFNTTKELMEDLLK